jgi:hypothetical protein
VPVRERARSELGVHPGGVTAGVDSHVAEFLAEPRFEERSFRLWHCLAAAARADHLVRQIGAIAGDVSGQLLGHHDELVVRSEL